jgi:aspartokinase
LETIAVYWENKAKTYGFQTELELSLFQISSTPHQLAKLGSVLLKDTRRRRFSWVQVQASSPRRLKICLVLSQAWAPSMQALVGRFRENNSNLDLQTVSPVELICFHGPHFGDRYGIADTALGALRKKGLPILVAGCTCASVYIVVPENRSKSAIEILSDVFDTPRK